MKPVRFERVRCRHCRRLALVWDMAHLIEAGWTAVFFVVKRMAGKRAERLVAVCPACSEAA